MSRAVIESRGCTAVSKFQAYHDISDKVWKATFISISRRKHRRGSRRSIIVEKSDEMHSVQSSMPKKKCIIRDMEAKRNSSYPLSLVLHDINGIVIFFFFQTFAINYTIFCSTKSLKHNAVSFVSRAQWSPSFLNLMIHEICRLIFDLFFCTFLFCIFNLKTGEYRYKRHLFVPRHLIQLVY